MMMQSIMKKRGREDGQISKEDYKFQEEQEERGEYTKSYSSLSDNLANPSALSTRKIVTAQRKDKKQQFAQHLYTLNTSFYKWLKEQIEKDEGADLTDGFQDYIDYVSSLEDRYLRKYGEVLTFGSGDCGQLAHGTENMEDLEVKYPRIVYSLRDKKVCGIACGGIHNAIYTESGQVYTWGCADDGSLGRTGDESIPMLVEGLVDEIIIRIACGDGQTIAVSTKGEVWGWGCYKDKEGKKWFNPSSNATNPSKDIKKQQNDPMKLIGLENIVDVVCGSAFNLAKSDTGKIYSWGIGESGELGRYSPSLKVGNGEDASYDLPNILAYHITPGPMYYALPSDHNNTDILNMQKNTDSMRTAVTNVKSFGCGAYHSMLTIVGDKVYACGLNNYGQLGVGDTTLRYYLSELTALENHKIVAMCGGMHHSLTLSSTGVMYTFGRGDSGQLGSSEIPCKRAGDYHSLPIHPTLPSNDIVIKQINCGGNHNLALTDKNELYTWGYGDMLALGHGEEKDEPLPKKLNFAKGKIKNIKIIQVAGGGQHSAVVGEVIST